MMGFNQFLATYPMADWVWELIKGLIPTAVALYAIWANDKRARVRELKSGRSQRSIEYINHMIQLLQELSVVTRKNQKMLYDIIFALDDNRTIEETKKIKSDYIAGRFDMMDRAYALKDYELTMGEALGVSFNASFLNDSVAKYQQELLNLRKDYQCCPHNEEEETVVMKRLNEVLAEVRTDIFSCIKLLASRVNDEYKNIL